MIELPRRQLGPTGIAVSNLCLGTMQFGWTADEATSFAIMDRFVEAGGNFLDTADIYTNWKAGNPGGVAEEIIGRWMKSRGNRDEIVVATKVRGRMWEGDDGEGLSRAHILRAVEDSLRRLQVDRIDLYQTHWDDESVALDETLRTLDSLVRQGKVLHLGCSNYTAARIQESLERCAANDGSRYVSVQPHFSLLRSHTLNPEMMGVVRAHSLAILPYSPLAGGLLTGRYRTREEIERSNRPESLVRAYLGRQPASWEILDQVRALADKNHCHPAQIALRWILDVPGVTTPIVGASTVAQLEVSLGAQGIEIDPGDLQSLTRFVTDHPPIR